MLTSKRIEQQLKSLQEKSESKKMQVGARRESCDRIMFGRADQLNHGPRSTSCKVKCSRRRNRDRRRSLRR